MASGGASAALAEPAALLGAAGAMGASGAAAGGAAPASWQTRAAPASSAQLKLLRSHFVADNRNRSESAP
jgi:hypothetical protein